VSSFGRKMRGLRMTHPYGFFFAGCDCPMREKSN